MTKLGLRFHATFESIKQEKKGVARACAHRNCTTWRKVHSIPVNPGADKQMASWLSMLLHIHNDHGCLLRSCLVI